VACYPAAVRWASSISDASELDAAVEQTTAELRRRLHDRAPDLLIVFITREHQMRWHDLPAKLHASFPDAVLIGCSGAGVLADGRELEGVPGLALAGAVLPGVELTAFHLPAERTPDPSEPGDEPGAERARWNHALGLPDGPDPHLILLPDPFTWSGPELLDGLDRAYPSGVKLGGLCSGGGRPGEHRLFCQRSAHHRGMVGVALRGNLEVDAIVAQGCRPIGTPMFVTRHQDRVMFELDGRPAVEVLQRLFDELSPADRVKAQHSLFIGIVMDPQREVYDAGDFLVRNLVGVDPQSGAIGTAAQLHKNAVVQFHLRDAETSATDLRALLQDHAQRRRGNPSHGALLFSCLGRGQGLYGQPDHDSSLVRELLGSGLPIVGFFGNGEIGPVAGRTHMHGYTSSLMLFRPARAP
jgi:small ligand-binding sensory domain FIST